MYGTEIAKGAPRAHATVYIAEDRIRHLHCIARHSKRLGWEATDHSPCFRFRDEELKSALSRRP